MMRQLRYGFIICMSLFISKSSAFSDDALRWCRPPDWFRCTSGRCLSHVFVCDGEGDCEDGLDEQNCPGQSFPTLNITCSSDEFQCKDKICIPYDDFCDRHFDCSDKSDEYIGCTEHKICKDFRCTNGYCVKNEWVCDGVDDCEDFSDEINCGNRTIPPEQCNNGINRYMCNNGRCIFLNKTCNEIDDCGDNSDEHVTGCKISEEACKKGIGCSHNCDKTPKGPACSCPTGQKLVKNQTCEDTNECVENPTLCDQRCINKAGSYYCICEVGYTLQDDKKTCKAEAGEALMIFSSRKEIRGFYLESEVYFPIATNLQHVVGVSMDADYIYWSNIENGNEAIMRSRDDGTKIETIVTAGIGLPEDIAVDWITGNVYFTDSLWKHIGVCKNDGEYCTVIIKESVDMPRGIVLYPINGEMFWSDFGEKPHISRAGMDGNERQSLVDTNLQWPNGLAIDYPNRRLYWVDGKKETIESIRLDGFDRREVLKTTATHPYSIAIFENKLYWSDWETKTIQSADKFTGKYRKTLVREIEMIYGIHVYHSVLKPKIPNPCNSQPCSHLCLLARNRTYSCSCTLDKVLGNDKHNCRTLKKQEHLVIAAGNTFVDYYHEIIGKPRIIGSLTLKRIDNVAYNSITGSIMANDQSSSLIFKFNDANGKMINVTSTGNEYIGGMDFDYYGNNIYWTDLKNRTIEIYSLEKKAKTRLHFMEEPSDILVIPKHGIMFVVFKTNEKYHIDKLQMSGSGPRIHVVDDLRGPKISIAYDDEFERIFWADQGTGNIETINIDGSKRSLFRTGVREPVALAIVGIDVFWITRDSNVLHWADKLDRVHGEKSVNLRIKNETKITDIATKGGIYGDNQHVCRDNNGGCSHVCLVAVTQYHVCACPTGMILNSDKRTCKMQFSCASRELRCSDSNECISQARRCNGIQDCPNGEDEDNCDSIKSCGIGEFTCKNGQCTDIKNRCNSLFDCSDQSDEVNCDKEDCKMDEFQCLDGRCITKFLVCDGHNDCNDFSDETNCGRHICDDESFRCASGTCIPKSWECDGQNDCDDSSDETSERCKITKCPGDMFQCENKRCLDAALVCDKVNDCNDNSDEENCDNAIVKQTGCTINEYKCHETEKCISLKLRCNGQQDCPKNDDEHRCAQCESDEFACESKKCIPQLWYCDGMNDCGDNSDETNCNVAHKNIGGISTKGKSMICEEFKCTIGTCLPWEKVCDGNPDCFDGSDEGGKCSSSCSSIDPCEQLCEKTPTGPMCLCQKGYSLKNNGRSCEDVDECKSGICPQICHNQPGSFACSCFEGYVLRSNRISCKIAGESMEIITATKTDIRKISSNLGSIEIIHRQPNVDITGLDVNTNEKTLYWSNQLLGTVNRLNLKTKEFKLVSGLGRPGVLAVDWTTDNVYFHDGEKDSSIKVCNLEEHKCAQIVKIANSATLMSIAINPKNGYLFWSEASFAAFENPVGEIFRTDMSGSNRMSIANERIGVVSGIAIDHTRSHLYWADSTLEVVERSNLDGENRAIFLQQQIYRPIGINVFEDSVYWLMGTSGIIKKCDIHGDKVCESIDVKSSNINDFFVISQKSRQPKVKNICQNHKCDYMCVLRNDEFACICSNGDRIHVNATCDKETIVTSPLKFQSSILGSNKSGNRAENKSGLLTGLFITMGIGIAVASAYYYYQKKKFNIKHDLSIHFQNPSFGNRPSSGLASEIIVPILPPGEHEYTNPMNVKQSAEFEKSKVTGRRTIELINSDLSETELEDITYTHDSRLIH